MIPACRLLICPAGSDRRHNTSLTDWAHNTFNEEPPAGHPKAGLFRKIALKFESLPFNANSRQFCADAADVNTHHGFHCRPSPFDAQLTVLRALRERLRDVNNKLRAQFVSRCRLGWSGFAQILRLTRSYWM